MPMNPMGEPTRGDFIGAFWLSYNGIKFYLQNNVLGTPTREEIKCMNPNYTEYKFPQIKAHPWHKIFHKRMPPKAVDFVSRLLQYSPNLRSTALEAMIHPFYDELHDPATRLPNGRFLPPLFNFKPHAGRTLIGLTCGYLVFCGKKTSDFWLLNPITRHELHFRAFPLIGYVTPGIILVFSPSPSLYGWVLVVSLRNDNVIWFSIVGKGIGAWNRMETIYKVFNMHAFKGRIYTINVYSQVEVVIFNPDSKKRIRRMLKIKKLDGLLRVREIASLGETFM
ncbi:hypothetical protein OROMI_017311 [Orobanche minor]